MQVRLRPLHHQIGQSFDTIEEALACQSMAAGDEPVIEWAGSSSMAALDLDYREPLPEEKAIAMVTPIQPSIWWITHGGGLRLIFKEQDGFDADELAALSALRIQGYFRAEILTHTRHPWYPRSEPKPSDGKIQHRFCDQKIEIEAARKLIWGRDVNEADIAKYLEENQLEKGKRYAHDKCPGRPEIEKSREPVNVRDYGIYCHACHNEGFKIASNIKPGWFPWSHLVGHSCLSVIGEMVKNMCHWGHAKIIMSSLIPQPESILKPLYSCLLKLEHKDDGKAELIPSAMIFGDDILRFSHFWGNSQVQAYKEAGIEAMLSKMPASMVVEAEIGRAHV